MRTENPFFAKNLVYSYCDDTEPKAYPHLYDEYVLKSEADEWKRQWRLELAARNAAELEIERLKKGHWVLNKALDDSTKREEKLIRQVQKFNDQRPKTD